MFAALRLLCEIALNTSMHPTSNFDSAFSCLYLLHTLCDMAVVAFSNVSWLISLRTNRNTVRRTWCMCSLYDRFEEFCLQTNFFLNLLQVTSCNWRLNSWLSFDLTVVAFYSTCHSRPCAKMIMLHCGQTFFYFMLQSTRSKPKLSAWSYKTMELWNRLRSTWFERA